MKRRRLALALLALCLGVAVPPSFGGDRKVGALLDQLSDPGKAVWLPAAEQLVAMGRSAVEPLKSRRAAIADPRTAARFDSVLAQVARLQVVLTVSPRTLKVGAPVFYDVTLRNDSGQELRVPLVDEASTGGSSSPRLEIEILAPDGRPASLGAPWVQVGDMAAAPMSFRKLGDGHSCSAFVGEPGERQMRAPGHWWWTPPAPGLYQLRIVYDCRGLGSDVKGSSAPYHDRVASEWVSIHAIN